MWTVDDAGSTGSVPVAPAWRRRRLWLIVAGFLVMVCSVPTAALVWFFRGTVAASQGAGSPSAAVYAVMSGVDRFGKDDVGDLLRYMSSDHAEQIQARVLDLRRQLNERPYRAILALSTFETVTGSDDRASVTVDIQVVVTPVRGPSLHSEPHSWVF